MTYHLSTGTGDTNRLGGSHTNAGRSRVSTWLVAFTCCGLIATCTAAAEFRVESNDAQPQIGELKKLDETEVVLLVDGEERRLSLENVTRVAPTNGSNKPVVPPQITVTLEDGTTLGGQEVTTGNRQLTLRSELVAEVSVPTKSVRHVRLKTASEEFDAGWSEYISKPYEADVLVIRKPAGTLDFFKGVVDAIETESVKFQFDGQTIDVPRQRVEGIIFFTPESVSKLDPLCRVTLLGGSIIPGRAILLRDQALSVTTPSAIELSLPITSVSSIDFSSGKIVYLSELEPASLKVQPKIPSMLNDNVVALLYQPRRNTSLDGDPLRLTFPGDTAEEKEFSKGLSIHSRTELIWRLGGQYRKLQGWAGIDPEVQGEGQVRLAVQGDGKVLYDKPITGSEAPLPLEIDVSGVDRLTLLVDYGDQTDIGDRLNLCELRVTK